MLLFAPHLWPVLIILGILTWFFPLYMIGGYLLLTWSLGSWLAVTEQIVTAGEPQTWRGKVMITLTFPLVFLWLVMFPPIL